MTARINTPVIGLQQKQLKETQNCMNKCLYARMNERMKRVCDYFLYLLIFSDISTYGLNKPPHMEQQDQIKAPQDLTTSQLSRQRMQLKNIQTLLPSSMLTQNHDYIFQGHSIVGAN